MFLLEWYREFLEIRSEFKGKKLELRRDSEEPKICQSCETLKQLLIDSNAEKMRILNKILHEPTKPEESEVGPPIPVRPQALPWHIRRQMLEKEDRHKAQLLKDAPKPTVTNDAEMKEFEKELEDAQKRREAQKSS